VALSFKIKMEETAKTKNSRIILALDFPFQAPENRAQILSKAQSVLEAVNPYICAVKINHHLTLPLGLFDGVQQLVTQIHAKGLLAIMDAKVNDIGNTNQIIADYYFAAGFDAIIANPFVGWDEGLKPLFESAKRQGKGVILLAYMSHKGAIEGYGQTVIDSQTDEELAQYLSFAEKALKWGADGVVVGATVPEKIFEVKEILGDSVAIYSPGVGAQGGAADAALNAGASYLIVGREIANAADPAQAARQLCGSMKGV
jgi:orotidine-5'-phosphate decarboxylase